MKGSHGTTPRRMVMLTAAMLAACTSARLPERAGSSPTLAPELTNVLKGGSASMRQPLREVIRDSIRWRNLRDSLYVQTSGPEPTIDFRREMLLLAVGPRAGLQDSVMIRPIPEQAMQVRVVQYRGCHPASISVMPFHVVRVPRREGHVQFEEQTVVDPEQCVQ